jgi:hypothetical protein
LNKGDTHNNNNNNKD